MTYEQKIIYDTLCEVRDKIYDIADKLKEASKDKQDRTITEIQIGTVETTALVVALVAQNHGLKIVFEETELI